MIKMAQEYFEISSFGKSRDFDTLKNVILEGIDSRLEGFTKSTFQIFDNRLYCKIHLDELQILIRRLLELGDENAESMADMIVNVQFGAEVF